MRNENAYSTTRQENLIIDYKGEEVIAKLNIKILERNRNSLKNPYLIAY